MSDTSAHNGHDSFGWRPATWADVSADDVVRTKGRLYTVLGVAEKGGNLWVKMAPPAGDPVVGKPDPFGPVEIRQHDQDAPAVPAAPDVPALAAPVAEIARVAVNHAAERAAVAVLADAGLEPEVIERVMALDELAAHLADAHGAALPAQGRVLKLEYRGKLADMHFALHADGQEPSKPWQGRGALRLHVHPVMDRPMPAGAIPRRRKRT